MKSLLLLLLVSLCSSSWAAVHEADVCVFGGTSGGVTAAVQAARMGKTVILAEPGKHLGGMTSGGLSAVDIGDPGSVGGIAREYFTQLAATVGVKLAWDQEFKAAGGGPATGGAYAIEPHKAEQVFAEMVAQAGVKVHFNARLASVKKDGARITQIIMENGDAVSAVELFDLKSDPGETRNLAGTHPDEVARLMERVESARADLGDYDRVGAGQRFFDDGPKRRDITAWKQPAKKAAKKDSKTK